MRTNTKTPTPKKGRKSQKKRKSPSKPSHPTPKTPKLLTPNQTPQNHLLKPSKSKPLSPTLTTSTIKKTHKTAQTKKSSNLVPHLPSAPQIQISQKTTINLSSYPTPHKTAVISHARGGDDENKITRTPQAGEPRKRDVLFRWL